MTYFSGYPYLLRVAFSLNSSIESETNIDIVLDTLNEVGNSLGLPLILHSDSMDASCWTLEWELRKEEMKK